MALHSLSPQQLEQRLRSGANPDQPDEQGFTALFHAAGSLFDIKTTRILLKYGANPNVKDPSGDTLAHVLTFVAAYEGIDGNNSRFINLLKLLHRYGLDLNQRNAVQDTCLHMACSYSSLAVIGWLLCLGADSSIKDRLDRTSLEIFQLFHGNTHL